MILLSQSQLTASSWSTMTSVLKWKRVVRQKQGYRILWLLYSMSMLFSQFLCPWQSTTVSYRYWQLTGNKYKVCWHTQQSKYNQIHKNPYCVQFIDFLLCSSGQSRQSEVFCKIGLKNKCTKHQKKPCKKVDTVGRRNGDTRKGICILTVEIIE